MILNESPLRPKFLQIYNWKSEHYKINVVHGQKPFEFNAEYDMLSHRKGHCCRRFHFPGITWEQIRKHKYSEWNPHIVTVKSTVVYFIKRGNEPFFGRDYQWYNSLVGKGDKSSGIIEITFETNSYMLFDLLEPGVWTSCVLTLQKMAL